MFDDILFQNFIILYELRNRATATCSVEFTSAGVPDVPVSINGKEIQLTIRSWLPPNTTQPLESA